MNYNIVSDWRKRHGITVSKAALALRVSETSIRRWEKGAPPYLVIELLRYWIEEPFGKVTNTQKAQNAARKHYLQSRGLLPPSRSGSNQER